VTISGLEYVQALDDEDSGLTNHPDLVGDNIIEVTVYSF